MSNFKKLASGFKSTISQFRKDERGNFTMLFAGASVAILMAGGLALDTSRMYTAKTKLNNAIDSAVLATTRDLTTGVIATADAEAAVENFIYTNMELGGFNAADVKIDDIDVDPINKTVEIDAHIMLPMTLTAIAGWDEVKVASNTKAEFADDRIEIAMALDVTGSMGNKLASGKTRMEALKAAAESGLDILFAGDGANRVRVGLVPYSASVNITPLLSTTIEINGDTQGCVVERTGFERFSDNYASYGQAVTGLDYPTSHNLCPSNEIVPMTSDINTLKTYINAFGTGGTTAGHVGIAWAQYMLSANWNAAWPSDSQAASTSDSSTKKYAIIMTDGRFNTFASDGYFNDKAGVGKIKSSDYAKGLCNNMKAGTIKVFTINFAGGTDAENLMKDCASAATPDSQFFFNATDEESLKDAFEAIAKGIKKLRLIG